jgi:hypothetical protein
MQVAHLGDGMSEGFVKCTFGGFAAMKMSNRNTKDAGSSGGGECFIAIPQDNYQVWLEFI